MSSRFKLKALHKQAVTDVGELIVSQHTWGYSKSVPSSFFAVKMREYLGDFAALALICTFVDRNFRVCAILDLC